MKWTMFDYISNPSDIYSCSFKQIRNQANFDGMCDGQINVAVRLIHACGMLDIVKDLRFSAGAVKVGKKTLETSTQIFVDSEMVGSGIIKSQLSLGSRICCTLNNRNNIKYAKERGMTRSAVAVDEWVDHLGGAIVVFGNAPTALFRLLELLNQGVIKPALILAFPVGFVGAEESKKAVCEFSCGVPYITLLGRRGGSAIAAAAVNALSCSSNE